MIFIKKKTMPDTLGSPVNTTGPATLWPVSDGIGHIKSGTFVMAYKGAGNKHDVLLGVALSALTGSITAEDTRGLPGYPTHRHRVW